MTLRTLCQVLDNLPGSRLDIILCVETSANPMQFYVFNR